MADPAVRTNQQVIVDLYRMFAARDLEGIRAIFHPSIEWIQMDGFPKGGRYIGPDAIFENVFAGFRENWSGWKAVVTDYLCAEDRVVAFGYYEGTFVATHRHCRAAFAHVYTVQSGQVTRFEQFTDTLLVAQAMGGCEPAPSGAPS